MAKYVQTFEVSGHGTFPFDMLRYDYCYPQDSESAANMVELNTGIYGKQDHRTVKLSRHIDLKTICPTIARWKSFGWNVDIDSIKERKL